MKTEMIDWNKNVNLYTGRDLYKPAGNGDEGLAGWLSNLADWIGNANKEFWTFLILQP